MSTVLSGPETQDLLNIGASYIELMGGLACDYLAVGPTADVRINPSNPRKLQIALRPNSEAAQLTDLARMAEVLGDPSIAIQAVQPIGFANIGLALGDAVAVHSLGIHEATFTNSAGVDVSLAALSNSLSPRGQTHQAPETIAHIRNFADIIGGLSLDFCRVNIVFLYDDSPFTICSAHALADSTTLNKMPPTQLGEWTSRAFPPRDKRGISARQETTTLLQEINVLPDL